jgi:hypothetical protein
LVKIKNVFDASIDLESQRFLIASNQLVTLTPNSGLSILSIIFLLSLYTVFDTSIGVVSQLFLTAAN